MNSPTASCIQLTFYCPVKMYIFDGMDNDLFFDKVGFDSRENWQEYEIANHVPPAADFISEHLINFGTVETIYPESVFQNESTAEQYIDVVAAIHTQLENRNNQLWLRLDVDCKRELLNTENNGFRCFLAEQLIIWHDDWLNAHGIFTCSNGSLFTHTLDVCPYYAGPNYYAIEDNHLLSNRQMGLAGHLENDELSEQSFG